MSPDTTDQKADKISLIYEFNNNSPLFVRVANTLLGKFEINDAIKVLEKGLAHYPNYPTAYLVYGKTLAIKGELDKAKAMIEKGCEILDSPSTKQHYIDELGEITREYKNYSGSVAEDFVPDKFDEEQKPVVPIPDFDISNNKIDEFADSNFDIEKLSQEISKAKMPRVTGIIEDSSETEPEFEDSNIISETLAGIYAAQENYKEAMSVYKRLIDLYPHNFEHYHEKLTELEELIKNKDN